MRRFSGPPRTIKWAVIARNDARFGSVHESDVNDTRPKDFYRNVMQSAMAS
jgi:hypothetical protein